MSQPFIGEIRLVPYNFAPQGWAFCNGQLMAIDQNTTLFQLIGTTYGGDGQNTFALPDLQGRVPIGQGGSFSFAQKGGVETVTLTEQQLPSHTHVALCDNSMGGNQLSPAGGVWSFDTSGQFGNYAATTTAQGGKTDTMNPGAVGGAGGSQPHDNRQPYLGLNYIISLFGIFPTQN